MVGDRELTGATITNTVVISSGTPDADWSNHLAWWSTDVLAPVYDCYLPLVFRATLQP